jgi:hypothetical protein
MLDCRGVLRQNGRMRVLVLVASQLAALWDHRYGRHQNFKRHVLDWPGPTGQQLHGGVKVSIGIADKHSISGRPRLDLVCIFGIVWTVVPVRTEYSSRYKH